MLARRDTARKLPSAISCENSSGLLDTMAYDAIALDPGLSLLPNQRRMEGHANAAVCQPVGGDGAGGVMARCRLGIYGVGFAAWGIPGRLSNIRRMEDCAAELERIFSYLGFMASVDTCGNHGGMGTVPRGNIAAGWNDLVIDVLSDRGWDRLQLRVSRAVDGDCRILRDRTAAAAETWRTRRTQRQKWFVCISCYRATDCVSVWARAISFI